MADLKQALADRILVLDGAMGTMIQRYLLDEAAYRGERFANFDREVKGNNDLLSLTQPDIIREIHGQYLDAGSDIVETNTFSATTIAQADYAMEDLAYELNKVSAELAREAAESRSTADKPRFVLGAIGPTNRTASISPDVNDPGKRNVTFDELVTAYRQAAEGLIDGGVDGLLIETIFDTLNAKAAIFACKRLQRDRGLDIPLLLSGTITDASGRTLSGQTTEAFYNSVRHARPLAIGLNCALGPDALRQYVSEMARIAEGYTLAYPNAGLPNEFGEYDMDPEEMAEYVGEWADSGLVNLVGGCCGSTPDHIGAIANAVAGKAPRQPSTHEAAMRLSGLEPFTVAA